MKPVRCSWVDMLKIRDALAAEERGDQSRLRHIRCVNKSTVSEWKAACDLVRLVEGKVGISQLSTMQPSHATVIVRHYRKAHGKDSCAWPDEVKDEIVDWVERVEAEKLTVQQLRGLMVTERNAEPLAAPCTAADLAKLVVSGEPFGTIYADPPWQYDKKGTRASASNHYATMALDDICALPVAQLAAKKACLFLWTTTAFLPQSFRVIEAWGFEYKSLAVWCKPQIGCGNYFRQSTELLMVGTRGDLKFRKPVKTNWFVHDRLPRHGQKPEKFRQIIESVSPGPYLELFGRAPADSWTVWGNQIERSMFDDDVKEM